MGCLAGQQWVRIFNDAVEEHYGYQSCIMGWVVRSRQDTNPVTPEEYVLLTQMIEKYKPNIIGISARSLHDHLMPTLVPFIRKSAPDSLIVAGGYGPTLNIEHYLRHGVDVVVRGEGEEALKELADAVEQEVDWREIQNISFFKQVKQSTTPCALNEKISTTILLRYMMMNIVHGSMTIKYILVKTTTQDL